MVNTFALNFAIARQTEVPKSKLKQDFALLVQKTYLQFFDDMIVFTRLN